jgi:vacuolar iron transporter family protein
MRHIERHRSDRAGWLRASVLGANDGIVSTASLIVGVAASGASSSSIAVAGFAALVAGAMSMAAGEYVSVSSQADTEQSDLAREAGELAAQPAHELAELTGIYVRRGLDPALAAQVATQLTAHDALAAHARDELGISDALSAKPLQAAFASAAAFAVGAALPLAALAIIPTAQRIPILSGFTLVCLALLGYAAAKTGGSSVKKSVLRVTFWGAIAMGATALIGKLVGVSV